MAANWTAVIRPMANGIGLPGGRSKFSVMVDMLRDELKEVDVNPIIVNESGCTIVDGLVVSTES